MQNTTTVVTIPPFDKGTGILLGVGLALFAGVHGGLRFYIGDIGLGIAQCVTCGGTSTKNT